MSTVLFEHKNRVATLTLNRPEHRNAVTLELVSELHASLLHADQHPDVSVIVLTGAGSAFCVGIDVNAIKTVSEADSPQAGWPFWPLDPAKRHDYQATHNYFPAISKPIIAMLNGPVAGLGMVFATFSDICIASDKATFSTAFSRRAIPAENGLAWILPRMIGHARAAELLLSGRKFDADEALRIGLVAFVHPQAELAEKVRHYAEEMAQWCAPVALTLIKRQIWEAPFQTLAEANMMFKGFLPACMKSDDFREAAKSFLEKRPPRFSGT